jgi:hypothetical protein
MRAFIITVLHEGYRGVFGVLGVIRRCDGYLEHDLYPSYFGRFSSAGRMPSTPGFTPIGEQ